MPAKSIDPLTKVTVDLYTADVEFCKRAGAINFAELLRKLLHDHVTIEKAAKQRMTLADLDTNPRILHND